LDRRAAVPCGRAALVAILATSQAQAAEATEAWPEMYLGSRKHRAMGSCKTWGVFKGFPKISQVEMMFLNDFGWDDGI